jgi:hypothetical protein
MQRMTSKTTARAKHTRKAKPQPLPAPAGGPAAVVLTGDRKRLWDDIRQRYVLEAASQALLRTACEALERAAGYAAQVERDGGTFVDRFGGVRVNPAANLERDFRGLAARTLQQLAARLEG